MAERILVEPADGVGRGDGPERFQQVLSGGARGGDGEDLDPVAGGDEQRFLQAGKRLQLTESLADLIGLHGDLLAHRDGRLLVGDTDADQRHAAVPCRAGAAVRSPA